MQGGPADLFGAGLNAGGVEALGEAAVFFEIAALALDLAFEEIGRLIGGTKHGIGREFGFGFGDELSESGKPGEVAGTTLGLGIALDSASSIAAL